MFAPVGHRRDTLLGVSRAIPPPLRGAERFKMGRPLHSSVLKRTSKSLRKSKRIWGVPGIRQAVTTSARFFERSWDVCSRRSKRQGGSSHEDRNAQFEHLNQKCRHFQLHSTKVLKHHPIRQEDEHEEALYRISSFWEGSRSLRYAFRCHCRSINLMPWACHSISSG